jgi:transcriptional regulator with XRE-family HTH domain
MRNDRGWTQEDLGKQIKPPMAQESLWRLENPNKSNVTIGTLLRVASALDVALMVRFVPFSTLIDSTPWLSGGSRAVPEYSKDHRLESTDSSMAALRKSVMKASVSVNITSQSTFPVMAEERVA